MKKDRLAYEQEFIHANVLASGIAVHLANYLKQRGYPSVPVAANLVYRSEVPGGAAAYTPDISHRYLAVRLGVGHMGLSGNIITNEQGGVVIQNPDGSLEAVSSQDAIKRFDSMLTTQRALYEDLWRNEKRHITCVWSRCR